MANWKNNDRKINSKVRLDVFITTGDTKGHKLKKKKENPDEIVISKAPTLSNLKPLSSWSLYYDKNS